MKIQYCSDLHREIWKTRFEDIIFDDDTNLIIFAGDISNVVYDAMIFMGQYVAKGYKVIYVAGNHEYYHREYHTQLAKLRELAKEYGVHFLENDTVVIDGVNFIGATLWTDYKALMTIPQARSMEIVEANLNDHRLITYGDRLFTAQDALNINQESKVFIKDAVDRDMKNVVVTHHSPVMHAVAPRFIGDALNPGFVNDWEDYVKEVGADLWVFGHTHYDIEVMVGETPVVCAQLGYPMERASTGQTPFKPGTYVL
jgi:predicted phosphodiesterase